MAVKAEAGELGHGELLAEDAVRVVTLEDPLFQAGFDTASAFEERSFGRFEELLGPWKECFAGMDKLQLVSQIVVCARARKFRGLEFPGGEVDVGESACRIGRML